MEWLKASQRDAFGGESQPRFTASYRAHLSVLPGVAVPQRSPRLSNKFLNKIRHDRRQAES